MKTNWEEDSEPIHLWFGLTYANYLVVPRSALQSMPQEWQARFCNLLGEMYERLEVPEPPRYTVYCRDRGGRFVKDPVPHYQRGRTRLQPRRQAEGASR